jgi:hypothetical protein
MKKLAIGCGLALLVTGVAAAGVAYYVYRQVSSTVAQFAELGKITDIERDVRNRVAFTPPSTEELTEAQIEKLVKVQTHVRQKLGEQIKAFEAKYKALAEKQDATLADAPALLAAYRDLAATWLDAKRSQVEALNDAGLSLDEYRWIRHQAYRALGQPFVDLDIARIVDEAKRGVGSQASELKGAIGPAGPELNRQLVEKFKKLLEENIALASFGL